MRPGEKVGSYDFNMFGICVEVFPLRSGRWRTKNLNSRDYQSGGVISEEPVGNSPKRQKEC